MCKSLLWRLASGTCLNIAPLSLVWLEGGDPVAINGRNAGLRSGRACLGPSSHSVNLQIEFPPGGVRVWEFL